MILRAVPGRSVEVDEDRDVRFFAVPEVPEEEEDEVLASEIADALVFVRILKGKDPPAPAP